MRQQQVTIVRHAENESGHWTVEQRDHAIDLYRQGYEVASIATKIGKTESGTRRVIQAAMRKIRSLDLTDFNDPRSHAERHVNETVD